MSAHFVPMLAVLAAVSVPAYGADAPLFSAEKLTIPRVDSEQQVALYQDAVLVRLPSGDFRLQAVEALESGPVYQLPGIRSAEIRQQGNRPVAVLLRVSGADLSCDHIGPLRFQQRRVGSRFEVVISSRHLNPKGGPFGCIANERPFRLTVPLDVYGLEAGQYSFVVNGGTSGEFSLAEENRYPDDCHETLERGCPRD